MSVKILVGDCRERLKEIPEKSVQCVVTSPPYYGLRNYGMDGQIGHEETPAEFVTQLVSVFSEIRRVLRDDGTVWLNLGDSYAGGGHGGGGTLDKERRGWQTSKGKRIERGGGRWGGGVPVPDGLKPKDLIGIPWRVAFALQADGWYLRSDIIWHKPNPMPESVSDRPTKSHEYIFLLSKSERYSYDCDAIREPHLCADDARNDGQRHTYADDAKHNQKDPDRQRTKTDCVSFHPLGRNKRSVWSVTTKPFAQAHFATYPPDLIEPCIKAGCPVGGTVLDPFGGAGTTGLVADRLGRNAILCELNPEYAEMARVRISEDGGMFGSVEVSA